MVARGPAGPPTTHTPTSIHTNDGSDDNDQASDRDDNNNNTENPNDTPSPAPQATTATEARRQQDIDDGKMARRMARKDRIASEDRAGPPDPTTVKRANDKAARIQRALRDLLKNCKKPQKKGKTAWTEQRLKRREELESQLKPLARIARHLRQHRDRHKARMLVLKQRGKRNQRGKKKGTTTGSEHEDTDADLEDASISDESGSGSGESGADDNDDDEVQVLSPPSVAPRPTWPPSHTREETTDDATPGGPSDATPGGPSDATPGEPSDPEERSDDDDEDAFAT